MADQFETIRTFLAVVEGRGFNAAAQRLGLAKSAVSRRVGELEARLGTRLVNRGPRQISLTEAGQLFYGRTAQILADLAEAEALAASGSRRAAGRLRITAPVSFTVYCLAPVLDDFLRDQPEITVEVETSDRLVDVVGEGFDLALRISDLKDSALIQRRIATIRHVACASPAYLDAHGRPDRPSDLARHRGITYSLVEPRRYWMFAGDESVPAASRLSINNGDALREAAIAGAGIAVLPSFIAHRAIERGELEIVLRDAMRPPIALYALYPAGPTPAKTRLFIDHLLARFGREPFWDRALFAPPAPR